MRRYLRDSAAGRWSGGESGSRQREVLVKDDCRGIGIARQDRSSSCGVRDAMAARHVELPGPPSGQLDDGSQASIHR